MGRPERNTRDAGGIGGIRNWDPVEVVTLNSERAKAFAAKLATIIYEKPDESRGYHLDIYRQFPGT
ncbi:MAG: hypothetical protein GY869_30655 [Planctomycetes bacterium]|nr:hypothetical protein [Planctomycetota bacterium]